MQRSVFSRESLLNHVSTLILASIILVAGCTKSPEYIPSPPLPIGTKALLRETVVMSAVTAEDILSGKTPVPYTCQVSQGTPIASVHIDKEAGTVHAILEADSQVDHEYFLRTHSQRPLCNKGAIIEMNVMEFGQATLHLVAANVREKRQREAEREIREVLKQRQQ